MFYPNAYPRELLPGCLFFLCYGRHGFVMDLGHGKRLRGSFLPHPVTHRALGGQMAGCDRGQIGLALRSG